MLEKMLLPKFNEKGGPLPVNGKHGLCRSYHEPDELDIKAFEYAQLLSKTVMQPLYALDLGCSPYFPQSRRLAQLGFYVDAIDIEQPMGGFDDIAQQYGNRISYKVKNIADLHQHELLKNYNLIYSNRCLSFLKYQQAYTLIRQLVTHHSSDKTRYFLGFFCENAQYAKTYPMGVPLEVRYTTLDNPVARENQMLAPVCVYTRDEIINNLLGGLPITILDEMQAKSGSLKIIFEIK